MLTVVAIIGILALVSVPNFITYYQSNKMKASMRNFTTDLRTVRQLAITQGVQTRITFTPSDTNAPAARMYNFWQGDSAFGLTPKWTQLTQNDPTKKALIKGYTRRLEDTVYFPKTGQTFDSTGGVYSVIFYPDGRVAMPGRTTASIVVKTDLRVPKPQYTIDLSPSGRVFAR